MSRSNWYFIASVVGFLILAGFIWAKLKPAYPVVPSSEYQKAEDTEYGPGNPRCYPSRLNALPKGEAPDERYRCEQAAEEHRLKNDDLIQQTRSAEAAVALVGLTYGQSLMLLAGTIFGLLTLFAAFAAVLYAKRAADAAESGLDHEKNISRPYVLFRPVAVRSAGSAGSHEIWEITFIVENVSDTPARILSTEGGKSYVTIERDYAALPLAHKQEGEIVLGKGDTHSVVLGASEHSIADKSASPPIIKASVLAAAKVCYRGVTDPETKTYTSERGRLLVFQWRPVRTSFLGEDQNCTLDRVT